MSSAQTGSETESEVDGFYLFKCNFKNTVQDVLGSRANFKKTNSVIDWDINWTDIGWVRENFDSLRLDDDQVGEQGLEIQVYSF